MGKRRKNDAYYTPESATHVLLKNLNLTGRILEPCNGEGHISKLLPGLIITSDLVAGSQHRSDATLPDLFKQIQPNWTVTNPPFNQAFPILLNAYEHSTEGVAFLLRLSFLEPTYERGHWLAEHPPTQLIVLPRISFTGDGKTDSCTTAWMIWQKNKPTCISIEPK